MVGWIGWDGRSVEEVRVSNKTQGTMHSKNIILTKANQKTAAKLERKLNSIYFSRSPYFFFV